MVLMVLRLNRTFTSGFLPPDAKARRIYTLECSNSVAGVKGDPQGSTKAPLHGPHCKGEHYNIKLAGCSHS